MDIDDLLKNIGDENFPLNLGGFDLPRYDYPDLPSLPPNPTYELIEKQNEANDLLREISTNTSVLKELVEINRKTQLNTQELAEVMQEINAVAKANTKAEADSLLKKAINTINNAGESADNMASLINV